MIGRFVGRTVSSDADESTETRVERQLSEYAVERARDEPARRWTRSEDRGSLWELTARFNGELIRAAMEHAGTSLADETVDRRYEGLTGVERPFQVALDP